MFCGGCGLCCAVIAWWVCGALALVYAESYAEGCGWWLWGTFVAELAYLPFAMLFGCGYGVGACVSLTRIEDMSTDNAFMDGFLRMALFFVLNAMNGLLLGFGGYAIWTEDCIPSGTWLRSMSLTAFWMCTVTTAVNVILGLAEMLRACCEKLRS
jgi:hypothetical protein